MNEKDEDNSKVPNVCANLLSGKSLLQIHSNSGKTLPKEGLKEFKPTNSWIEKKQIQSILNDRKELLEVERVEKWGCLAGAVWDHRKQLAKVTKRTGKHFQALGFEKEGALYLYPEEALFLLETNSLELTFGGVPVSIQQGYSLLLGSSTGCDLNEYRTYSYLLRQGYKLLRFTKKVVHTKYERTIRLDQHAPLKRKHPGQITNEANSARKIKMDPCSVGRNVLQNLTEEEAKISEDIRQNFVDDKEIDSGEKRSEDVKKEPREESNSLSKSSNEKHVNLLDNETPVQCLDQHNENKCSQDGMLVNDESGTERDYTQIGKRTESDVQEHQEQQSKTDQHVEVTCNSDGNIVLNLNEKYKECTEVEISEEVSQSCVEGAKTKAYDIAESLFSLGSVIVSKRPNAVETNLNDTLQSEIRKLLGAHIETNVSEESLTAVATSAASTILSHITCGEKSQKYSGTDLSGPQIAGDGEEQCAKVLVESTACGSQSPANLPKEQCSDSTLIPGTSKIVVDLRTEDENNMSSMDDSSPGSFSNGTNNGNCVETSQEKKRCASPNEENNLSTAIPVKRTKTKENVDSLTEMQNFVENVNDIPSGRSVKVSEDEGCSLSPDVENISFINQSGKKCRELENIDLEVEIIDVVPEKKVVEFVNLSDESSVDDSVKGLVVENHDNDGIEVIDVQDTSSAESSDSDSTSSDSDDSVIEEKRNLTWEQERKKILETIPDMYNLSEISIKPPSSDLLPENVQPQRSCYRITRKGLLKDEKEKLAPNSQVAHQNILQTNDFNDHTSPSWQPSGPVPDLASVQAIAQLILPMLGLDPSVCLNRYNRAWMPHNPWFSSQSAWNPEPHVNQHRINEGHWNNSPRRNWANSSRRSWTYSPRGNWTQRHHFAQRPFRGVRGNRRFRSRPHYFKHFAPRYPYQQRDSNFPHHQNDFRHLQSNTTPNEFLPIQSSNQNESDDINDVPDCSTKANENLNETRPWSRIKQGKVKKVKSISQSRYFCPPKKYSHMKKILDENQEVVSLHSDELSTNQSTSTKSESDSSRKDYKTENLNEDEDTRFQDNDDTDDSCSSHSGTKPLLSPEHCTSFASVFKMLQVIKEADTRTLLSNLHEDIPIPKYDMFHPNKPFRKGSPPTPDFHLCIVGCSDSVPTPRAVRALSEALNDSVPILFGIVSPDSISFVQLCDFSLPSMVVSD
ncbi:tRNA-splicing endonuclease subunit Sen54 [Frankliniella fusca]|uniref:tRNA-splicing endonuclease subunit Sen54 n=1 Tax=Frankliniella fusca TaxID=407009 RepID=A0AAE1HUQ0_9NEOP|nr:tRNA-splicing endonuclease subunit Sen54 [Frankliniella fusca]